MCILIARWSHNCDTHCIGTHHVSALGGIIQITTCSACRFVNSRYCLVHLKPDADVDRVIQQLSKISFGAGKISVERKTKNVESKPTVSLMLFIIYLCSPLGR